MRTQMAKLYCNGTYLVIHDDSDKHNPYRVYREWHDGGKHRKLVAKYADMASCMFTLTDVVLKKEQGRTLWS